MHVIVKPSNERLQTVMDQSIFPSFVRPKLQLAEDSYSTLHILHPKYRQRFLSLGCRHQLENSPDKFYIYYDLVIQAAGIATQQNGFLSTSFDRNDVPGRVPVTELLIAGNYYYHLDTSNLDYPVCTDFDAWVPPKTVADLPGAWGRLPSEGVADSQLAGLAGLADTPTAIST